MPALRKNYDAAVDLYNSGMSIGDAAAAFGVTRQAMWKILKRRGVEFRSHLKFGPDNHFHRGGATRNINFVVQKAICRGILVVQPCEVCGLVPSIVGGCQRIHGHHDDYNFPLKVRWLCKRDHDEWHKKNRAVPRSADWRPMPRREIAAMGGKAPRKKRK